MKLLVLTFALAFGLSAQDGKAVHLPEAVSQAVSHLYSAKVDGDKAWESAKKQLVTIFASTQEQSCIGTVGDPCIFTSSPLPGFENGVIFTDDFAVMLPAPKPDPKKEEDKSDTSCDYVKTIQTIPYKDPPNLDLKGQFKY